MIAYPNVPGPLGAVVTADKATWHELGTVLGTQDLYDLLEIISVNAHNQHIIREAMSDEAGAR